MKRLTKYILLLTALCSACVQPKPVPSDSLSILSGISNNTLLFEGREGATASFSIASKFPWEVLDTPGVTYSPASGEATAEGTKATITATVNSANNTLQERELGDVIIRLLKTRFTGIVARQRPQIVLENTESITIAAQRGDYTAVNFECKSSDIEVVAHGNIECTAPVSSGTNRYMVTVAATADNLTAEPSTAGYLTFSVNGVEQEGKVDIVQQSAVIASRSRLMLNGTAGATACFAIDTPFDFTVSSSTSAFSAVKGEGATVLLTTNEANSGSAERKVGTLTITLAENSACSVNIDVWQRTATVGKSMLFYFLGTSLKGYYETNLQMVEQVLRDGKAEDCRVIAFLQSSRNSGTMFEMIYDKGLERVIREEQKVYDLPAVYNEQMLHAILADMISRAPAAEYGLFVGSHGKGWLPKATSNAMQSFSAVPYNDIWTPAEGALPVRHLGDSDNTQLNTTEFASAIARTGKKLNYIIFDACYMSNVESAYDMRACADYILASPCEVMASGMPYNKIVPAMAATGDVKSRLEASAKAFVDYYKENKQGDYCSACSAVIACGELEALAAAVRQTNASMKAIDHNTVQAYDGVSPSRNPTHIFFDLEDYISRGCTDTAAVESFKAQLSRTVSGLHHTDTFYSAYNNKANQINTYCGITTSAPITLDSKSAYIEEWKATEWAKKISY